MRLLVIKRIVLENFMSHRRTVIEPADGLTVLTGPNNCGKSAVVTAVQTLCYNGRGSQIYVRHGERQARVLVETAEGHKIEWARESDAVRYTINGVRTDRGVQPDDLAPSLRLDRVQGDDGTEFDIHFGEQKAPIFLLDRPASHAAAFFASSTDAGLLLQMQQIHRERTRARRAEERQTVVRADSLAKQLEAFEPVNDLDAAIALAEREHRELQDRLGLTGRLAAASESLLDLSNKVEGMAEVTLALGPLEELPDLADTGRIGRIVRQLEGTQTMVSQQSAYRDSIGPLAAPPSEISTQGVALAVRTLEARQRSLAKLSEKLACTQVLAEAPSPATDPVLVKLIGDSQNAIGALSAANQRKAECDAALDRARQEIDAYIDQHPTCPVCGGRLMVDMVLAGEHTHA